MNVRRFTCYTTHPIRLPRHTETVKDVQPSQKQLKCLVVERAAGRKAMPPLGRPRRALYKVAHGSTSENDPRLAGAGIASVQKGVWAGSINWKNCGFLLRHFRFEPWAAHVS